MNSRLGWRAAWISSLMTLGCDPGMTLVDAGSGGTQAAGGTDAGGTDTGGTDAGGAPGGDASSGLGGALDGGTGGSSGEGESARLLLMTKTAGFRHASIPQGIAAVHLLAEERGWEVTPTEDASEFNEATLSGFDAVMFLSTTGDILDATEQAAFEAFIARGGGFVGVHAATDTEADWAFYNDLLGTHFSDHPAIQEAQLVVEAPDHPATSSLPSPWLRTDEWYNFVSNPRPEVHVLLRLDESSYAGGTMGDHPIAWVRELGSSRLFYTALGHTPESYSEPEFLAHLAGGIGWVLAP